MTNHTAAATAMRIINVERVNTLPGFVGMPYDRAVIISTTDTERHIITGQPQPKTLYRGDLAGAHAFMKAASR